MFVGLHADSTFPMSEALRDGLPHGVDGVRAVSWAEAEIVRAPSHRTAGIASGCGYTNFEFASAGDGQRGAIC